MTTTAPALGPAFEGANSFTEFETSVKSEFRYVWSDKVSQFLDVVRASCQRRATKIPAGHAFFRARLGVEGVEEIAVEGDKVIFDKVTPYGPEAMKPIPYWQGEGRANPRGIPSLYMATTPQTALAEVRPWIGARVTVARMEVGRELNIIDCSKYRAPGALAGFFTDPDKTPEDGIWYAIDRAFATPVSKEDEAKDYIPTQIIAELFKSAKYDGIQYKSLLSEDGYNIALFNLVDANARKCAAFHVDSISFGFQPEEA